MHQFLRAIGFSQIKTKKELRELLHMVIEGCDTINNIETDRKSVVIEYTKQFAGPCGICIRAEIDDEKNAVRGEEIIISKDYHFSDITDILEE